MLEPVRVTSGISPNFVKPRAPLNSAAVLPASVQLAVVVA